MIATPPLTRRRRLFVAGILAGLAPRDAAIEAGYSPANAASIGCRLRRDPAVCAALATNAEIRRETLQQLEQIRAIAIERGDAAAAVRCVELRGRAMGVLT